MSKVHSQSAEIKIELIPAQRFIGVCDISVANYGYFWGAFM